MRPLWVRGAPGEAAALRWRHYDPTVTPRGRLLVAKSYSTRRDVEKSTKTDAVKHVPVHPVLAAMLAEWKLGRWAEMMGRAPAAARKSRNAFDGYNRGLHWDRTCAEIVKLRITRGPRRSAIEQPIAAGARLDSLQFAAVSATMRNHEENPGFARRT